jgi:hypothetical protein
MKRGPAVAVLGAGIMGCSVALFLARQGCRVVLIDASPAPFMGASRWNEGKIHLGYLYLADPSLKTARKLMPGGLLFPELIRALIDCDIHGSMVTQHDDRYLIHKNSVIDSNDALATATAVAQLAHGHPDADRYFVPLGKSEPRPLSSSEINDEYDGAMIVSGFEVPERSVATQELADRFVDVLNASRQIEQCMGHRVRSVVSPDHPYKGWAVETSNRFGEEVSFGPFGAVVNALWEGRGVVDATVGLQTAESWTHRYRVSLFAETSEPVKVRSAVVAVGPFGDIKNYDGKRLYISWYEAGLLASGHDLSPPLVSAPDRIEAEMIAKEKLQHLGKLIPDIKDLFEKGVCRRPRRFVRSCLPVASARSGGFLFQTGILQH